MLRRSACIVHQNSFGSREIFRQSDFDVVGVAGNESWFKSEQLDRLRFISRHHGLLCRMLKRTTEHTVSEHLRSQRPPESFAIQRLLNFSMDICAFQCVDDGRCEEATYFV